MTDATDMLLYIQKAGIVDISSLKSVFPNAGVALTRLVKAGKLVRLKRGYYTTTPFDPLEAAKYVSSGYVSFFSALYHYNAVSEVPSSVLIATRNNSRVREVYDTEFREVAIGKRFGGYIDEKIRIATRAKAVYDSFKRPDLSGGFSKLLGAVVELRLKKEEWKELLGYFKKFERPAAFQRMGYLLSLINTPEWVIEEFRERAGSAKVFLWGRSGGKLVRDWMVIDNVGKGVLLSWMKG